MDDNRAALLLADADDDRRSAEVYHESTKITRANAVALGARVSTVLNVPRVFRQVMRGYKQYAGAPRTALPAAELPSVSLAAALAGRRSRTSFPPGAIELAQLGTILGASYGPTGYRPIPGTNERSFQRATTSAGGLYPVELYVFAFDVRDLPAGVYHYDVAGHALDELRSGDERAALLDCLSAPDGKRGVACVVALTAVLPRTEAKYLHRGYRFAAYDVGAVLGSLYLTTTALGLGAAAIGGFFDDEVARLLDVDAVEEPVTMLFAVGAAAEEKTG